MRKHPYQDLPTHAFWRNAVAGPPLADVDPVVAPKFTISRADRVATAGSCFAQHIARHLSRSGFNYFVTEKARKRGKNVGTPSFFPCVDSTWSTLCIMCRRRPPSPR